jgi:signal transduction histidine kinase
VNITNAEETGRMRTGNDLLIDSDEAFFGKLLDECGEFFLLNSDGNIEFELKYKRIEQGKEHMKYLIVVKNIENIQKINKALAEQKYKHLLINTISHEFRTCLSGILGGLHLASDYISDEGRQYIDMALASEQKLEFFINDVLARFIFIHLNLLGLF